MDGRHNDTELHLDAQRGDLVAVKQILGDIDAQMTGTSSGAEFNAEVAEIELGETALFTAADKGHLDVVKELLKSTTKESISRKNRSGLDALHIAASQGHQDIVQVLLDHDPGLSKTVGPSNETPLISAARKGHTAVVLELLSRDSSMLEVPRSNGKNALHYTARLGHLEIVKALLEKDPQLARRTDKKAQTALHMAAKGESCDVVKLLLDADPAIVMLPDKIGNTALHVATRKKRVEIVRELLHHPDTNVNALTRGHKTPLDIADGLDLSEESTEIRECLARCGAIFANELKQARDELKKIVSQIKKDVRTQFEKIGETNKDITGYFQYDNTGKLLPINKEKQRELIPTVKENIDVRANIIFLDRDYLEESEPRIPIQQENSSPIACLSASSTQGEEPRPERQDNTEVADPKKRKRLRLFPWWPKK